MREDAPHRPDAAVRGYRIERLIGAGGAAAVYEARRLGPSGPGERVACKVGHAGRSDESRRRERVRQEAVIGLRVTAGHPNLVEVVDFFDDAEVQQCIVMELVDGASVADLRKPGQGLPFAIVRRIAIDVLEALVHLHGRGVLHRDLSPRNILVTAGGVVKVADLGIARVMEKGQVRTDTFRGTPQYANPEAIQLFALDVRADLYTLAAVLYELVAGTPPCGEQDSLALTFAHTIIGDFAPLPPDTPADLVEMISGLLRVERDARQPRTAAEALALLRSHGQPVARSSELAALVAAAQPRCEQKLSDDRPPNVLPPGHVLAPRDALPAEPPAERPGSRPASGADAVPDHVSDPLPEALLEQLADFLADAPPDHQEDHLDDHPDDHAEERAGDRSRPLVSERVDGAAPDLVARRASTDTIRPRAATTKHLVARRAGLVAAILACILVLGLLLQDGFQGQPAAVAPKPPVEMPALITEPRHPPLAVPVVVAPAPIVEAPRPARPSADGPRRQRIEVQGRSRNIKASARRREYVPQTSKLPAWVLQ